MFGFRKPPTGRAHGRALETALRAVLGLSDGDVVRVSEIACGAAGCEDVVTALLIMGHGRKGAIYRVAKPLPAVGLDDLLDAVRSRAADPGAAALLPNSGTATRPAAR